MANIVSHVSTIKELYTATNKNDTSGYKEIYLEADLDFNNEDYYYHPTDFFWTKGVLTIDGGVYENGVVTRNHTLTNAYVFPKFSFMVVDALQYNYEYAMTCNLKNMDFEVVLNDGYFLFLICNNNGYTVRQPFSSRIENCNFNIKMANIRNATSIFCNGGTYTARENGKQVVFVNCTFNIEITSSNVSEFSIFEARTAVGLAYSSFNAVSFAFESCEFRIKNLCSNMRLNIFKRGYAEQDAGYYPYNQENFYFNNCAFFLNNYYQPTGISQIWLLNETGEGWGVSNHVWGYNSFFASFADTPDGTIDPDYKVRLLCNKSTRQQIDLSSVFVDIDRINLSAASNPTYSSSFFQLHTSECKDETKLRQIGFLFATES